VVSQFRARRGPFLEGPEKFSHPENRSKISNHMITELFYSHILNMDRGSLHIRSFKRSRLSGFRYRLSKNSFAGPKSFFRERAFEKRTSGLGDYAWQSSENKNNRPRTKSSTSIKAKIIWVVQVD